MDFALLKPFRAVLGVLFLGAAGCASQAPTIAHVHVGHAITGHPATPGEVGFFQLAESQARAADGLARELETASSLAALQAKFSVLAAALAGDAFSFSDAVREAASHITFAANSPDATANVKQGAARFEQSIEGVLVRSELIDGYLEEARAVSDFGEARELAGEIQKLVSANLDGEDEDSNGMIGNAVTEFGIRQLREQLDAMVAAENPPYSTVDQYYLFNLIRLPDGSWAYRKARARATSGRPGYY